MTDIGPGDKVQCVSITKNCPFCGVEANSNPTIGRYYIVQYAGPGYCVNCGFLVDCIQTTSHPGRKDAGWFLQDFRKIDPGGSSEELFKLADPSKSTTKPKVPEPA